MATRSVIAKPDGDSWKGRHAHWDGYPSAMGPELEAIIRRDGAERARQVLVEENYGWSTIDHDQAEEALRPGLDDGRFKVVPGYGIAYTDDENVRYGPQVTADSWETPTNNDGEYVYVILDDGRITVHADDNDWREVGTFPTDGTVDWSTIEESTDWDQED